MPVWLLSTFSLRVVPNMEDDSFFANEYDSGTQRGGGLNGAETVCLADSHLSLLLVF